MKIASIIEPKLLSRTRNFEPWKTGRHTHDCLSVWTGKNAIDFKMKNKSRMCNRQTRIDRNVKTWVRCGPAVPMGFADGWESDIKMSNDAALHHNWVTSTVWPSTRKILVHLAPTIYRKSIINNLPPSTNHRRKQSTSYSTVYST
jgi:hypothetical protein